MQNVVDLLIHCFLSLYFQGGAINCLDAVGRLGKKTCMKQFVTRQWGCSPSLCLRLLVGAGAQSRCGKTMCSQNW